MKSATVRKHVLAAASLAAILSVAGGCGHHQEEMKKTEAIRRDSQLNDINIVDAVRDSGVKAAIISQHTLYPYHFEQDRANLNELGQRDLTVLAGRLRSHAGELNIPRNGTDAALYESRVQWVMESLKAQGIAADHVKIVEGVGMTDGAPSEDVVREVRGLRTQSQTQMQNETSSQSQSSGASMAEGQR